MIPPFVLSLGSKGNTNNLQPEGVGSFSFTSLDKVSALTLS
jgi:hypothetical protein